MKQRYKRAFGQAVAQTYTPLNRVEQQRSALASRCSPPELEVQPMKQTRKPLRILITAAAAAAALTVGALAASGVLSRISLFTGGQIEHGVRADGTQYTSASVSTNQERSPVAVRDGRVWFTTETGAELDITGQCSETEPYVYSYTDDSGLRHDLVVGGTAEDYGCFEFVYDQEHNFTGGTGSYPSSYDGTREPAWLTAYQQAHRLPISAAVGDSGTLVWLEPTLTTEEGRLLLTVNGETEEITGRFSQTEPYVHTALGTDGRTHMILVGGTAENPCEAEIILEADGQWTCSTNAPEDSPWLTGYLETLG